MMATAEENSAVYEFEEIDFDFDSDFDPEETESGVTERRMNIRLGFLGTAPDTHTR